MPSYKLDFSSAEVSFSRCEPNLKISRDSEAERIDERIKEKVGALSCLSVQGCAEPLTDDLMSAVANLYISSDNLRDLGFNLLPLKNQLAFMLPPRLSGKLVSLSIYGESLSNQDIKVIAGFISDNPVLTKLILRDVGLTDRQLKDIASSLSSSVALETLDIKDNNNVSADALSYLVSKLNANQTITKIILPDLIPLTQRSKGILDKLIARNKSLKLDPREIMKESSYAAVFQHVGYRSQIYAHQYAVNAFLTSGIASVITYTLLGGDSNMLRFVMSPAMLVFIFFLYSVGIKLNSIASDAQRLLSRLNDETVPDLTKKVDGLLADTHATVNQAQEEITHVNEVIKGINETFQPVIKGFFDVATSATELIELAKNLPVLRKMR